MRKYLILIPLIIGIISLKFFSAAYTQVMIEKHDQKYYDIRESVNMVSMQIALLNPQDISAYHRHKSLIQEQVRYIDEGYMVYAALYTEDLKLISERITWNESPFDPFAYNEFVEAIANNSYGNLKLPYDDGIYKRDEMSVYYKWTLTEIDQERYLLIAGVSLYSPNDDFAPWVMYGTLSLVGLLLVLLIWMVIRTSKLADAERDFQKKSEKVIQRELNKSERNF